MAIERETAKKFYELTQRTLSGLKDAMESSKIYEIPERLQLCPGKIAHYNSLLFYHNMEESVALKEAQTKSYDELNKKTHVDYFITSASEGFEKFLFKNGMRMTDLKEVVRGDGDFVEFGSGYLETVGKYINESFNENEMDIFEQYMNVAEYMNNKRIRENVPDDFYDNPTNEHKVLRELPLELAGMKEANNYYSFMIPLIYKFRLPRIGFVASNKSFENDNEYVGYFAPEQNTETFYSVRVLDFLEKNKIANVNDLKIYLKNIGTRFEPLNPENAPEGKRELAEKRIKFLTSDEMVEKISQLLLKENEYISECFKEFADESLNMGR